MTATLFHSVKLLSMGYSDTKSISRSLRKALGSDVFEPATSRLWWIPVHLGIIGSSIFVATLLARTGLSTWFLLPFVLINGMSFAGLAFVAHEALHGALTRHRHLRKLAGHIGFLPFWVSPRLWIMWHNNVHHGGTNIAGRDPDAYPTLAEYEGSWMARQAVLLGAPRRGKLRGLVTFGLGFTLQSLQILFWARQRKHLSSKHFTLAWVETVGAICLWATLGVWLGSGAFLFVYVLPLFVANAIVMAHIVTNHSLSPLSHHNDALETSLTVTVPQWFEFYTLGFGYHVEHHLFPAMSNRHAPRVQRLLREVAADRYQEMPLEQALSLVWNTPRVYLNHDVLGDPQGGETFPTLGRRPSEFPLVSEPWAVPEVHNDIGPDLGCRGHGGSNRKSSSEGNGGSDRDSHRPPTAA